MNVEKIVSGISIYPNEAKDEFLQTDDILTRDGTVITAAEVWDFLTEEGPKRYPNVYDRSGYFRSRISDDNTLAFTLKHNYLLMTMDDRMTKAKERGVPLIFVQGGQSVDPYYAAGAIALRPASTGIWSSKKRRGLNLVQEDLRSADQKEKAYHDISFEACNTAGYEMIQTGILPIDMVAPYSCLRCSDVSYGLEAHRHGKYADKVELFLVDFPMGNQRGKEWAVEYFAEGIKKLIQRIDNFTGHTTTAEGLRKEIKLHNQGRRLAMETADLWWSADVPPTNGKDRLDLFQFGSMESHGDPEATLSVLKEAKEHIAKRAKKGIKGAGVPDDAARLFVCGSCVFPNEHRIEEAGGVLVGNDNHWSDITTIIEEEGDPYYNLAKGILSYPYEQTIKERAAWTVEQIKKSRSDGVLFMYKWGCNTQSAVSRAVVDEIKKSTGLPTLIIEHEGNATQSEQLQNRVNAFIEMIN
jgi:benzoyl-CoA reductase/2-hydroxyglutaryl-CoA dehydratase subunit BcrC/BadD/HgdB